MVKEKYETPHVEVVNTEKDGSLLMASPSGCSYVGCSNFYESGNGWEYCCDSGDDDCWWADENCIHDEECTGDCDNCPWDCFTADDSW